MQLKSLRGAQFQNSKETLEGPTSGVSFDGIFEYVGSLAIYFWLMRGMIQYKRLNTLFMNKSVSL